MKILKLFVITFILCYPTKNLNAIDVFESSDKYKINEKIFEDFSTLIGIDTSNNIGKKVLLYNEFAKLFDPDGFKCGCGEKLKKALKNYKSSGEKQVGYIPSDIKSFFKDPNKPAIMFEGSGSNVLIHSFRYIDNNKVSKLIYADNAPTSISYNETDYLDKNVATFSRFKYTLDCSGYVSLALTVNADIGPAEIKTSADAAVSRDISLGIISGVIYSPLYQAYTGAGIFKSGQEKPIEVIKTRINELESILIAMHYEELDTSTIIELNHNYQVVLMSNNGKKSFNGKVDATTQASGGYFFVNSSIGGTANASIDRSSEFEDFNTYLINLNVGSVLPNITIAKMKQKIKELKTELTSLSVSK